MGELMGNIRGEFYVDKFKYCKKGLGLWSKDRNRPESIIWILFLKKAHNMRLMTSNETETRLLFMDV